MVQKHYLLIQYSTYKHLQCDMVSRRAESKAGAVVKGRWQGRYQKSQEIYCVLKLYMKEATNELLQIARGSLFHMKGAA